MLRPQAPKSKDKVNKMRSFPGVIPLFHRVPFGQRERRCGIVLKGFFAA
jgi:hypothetical protein